MLFLAVFFVLFDFLNDPLLEFAGVSLIVISVTLLVMMRRRNRLSATWRPKAVKPVHRDASRSEFDWTRPLLSRKARQYVEEKGGPGADAGAGSTGANPSADAERKDTSQRPGS